MENVLKRKGDKKWTSKSTSSARYPKKRARTARSKGWKDAGREEKPESSHASHRAKDRRKPTDHKGKSGGGKPKNKASGDHVLAYPLATCVSFMAALLASAFSGQSLGMMAASSLDIGSWQQLAAQPIAGRIGQCLPNWRAI